MFCCFCECMLHLLYLSNQNISGNGCHFFKIEKNLVRPLASKFLKIICFFLRTWVIHTIQGVSFFFSYYYLVYQKMKQKFFKKSHNEIKYNVYYIVKEFSVYPKTLDWLRSKNTLCIKSFLSLFCGVFHR